MKVLIAIDNSRYSEAALDHIKSRDWPDDAEFCICTVVPDQSAYAGMSEQAWKNLKNEAKELEHKSVQYIEEKQKELQKVFPGNEVFTVIEKGITSSKIVAIASMWQADLIVVGSYGFKGAEQLFLGSVADEVVEKAPCTVEIIRSATLIASRHDASFNFERIAMVPWSKVLVGCNFSTNATEAVKWIPTQQWEGVQRSFWLMLWFLANPPQTLSDSGSATNE